MLNNTHTIYRTHNNTHKRCECELLKTHIRYKMYTRCEMFNNTHSICEMFKNTHAKYEQFNHTHTHCEMYSVPDIV